MQIIDNRQKKSTNSIPDISFVRTNFGNFGPLNNFTKYIPPISVKKHMLILYRKKIVVIVWPKFYDFV